MGNLSEHFSKQDFICKCPECKGEEYRIHLGLVGALELIESQFKKTPQILSAFWCSAYHEKVSDGKKSAHTQGKAVHVRIDGVHLNELFRFVEENLPEINGLGYYPEENVIHIDTRKPPREMWIKEKGKYTPLTAQIRQQYNL